MLTDKVGAAAPMPLSATACGELAALSAKLTAADSVPEAAGVNVTAMTHEALAASVDPQLLVWEKEEALLPMMLIPETVMEAVPVLVRVTACDAEAV